MEAVLAICAVIVAGIVLVLAVWIIGVFILRALGMIVEYNVLAGCVALAAGFCWSIWGAIKVLGGRSESTPKLASPSAAHASRVFSRPPRGPAEHFGWDAAWPLYIPHQLRLDQHAIMEDARLRRALVWEKSTSIRKYGTTHFVTWSMAAVWVVAIAVPTLSLLLGLVMGTLLALTVTWAARLLGTVGQFVIVWVLRLNETVAIHRERTGTRCTRCYRPAVMPSYACPNLDCAVIHRDISPGPLGIRWRLCECGSRLPTTVRRASKTLDVLCPYCASELPRGSGSRSIVVVPVVGSVGSGKTQFLATIASGLVLRRKELAGKPTLTPLDNDAAAFLATAMRSSNNGQPPPKTPHLASPGGLPFLIGRTGSDVEVHLMDAAGENFVEKGSTTDLRYLDVAPTLLLILDPLSFPKIRSTLTRIASTDHLGVAEGGAGDAYGSVVDRLRDEGYDLRKKHFAVVVTKADVVNSLLPDSPLSGATGDVRKWLIEHGAGNLVRRAEIDFPHTAYFAVASIPELPLVDPIHPIRVLDWVLESHQERTLMSPLSPSETLRKSRPSQKANHSPAQKKVAI